VAFKIAVKTAQKYAFKSAAEESFQGVKQIIKQNVSTFLPPKSLSRKIERVFQFYLSFFSTFSQRKKKKIESFRQRSSERKRKRSQKQNDNTWTLTKISGKEQVEEEKENTQHDVYDVNNKTG